MRDILKRKKVCLILLLSAACLAVLFAVLKADTVLDAEKTALGYDDESDAIEKNSILEGKVLSVSDCPDPASIDYPDCNLTLTVSLNDSHHTKITLIVPCIRKSKVVFPGKIKPGSLISFKVIRDEDVSEQEKGIQISDDDPDFNLDYRYAERIKVISRYSKISVYKKEKLEDFEYDPHLALTDKDIVTRKEYMEKELKRLNGIIENFSKKDAEEFCDKFLDFTRDLGEKNHPYAEILYEDGSKKIFPVEIYTSPQSYLSYALEIDAKRMKNNAKVIASVNEFLKEKGILLIVVPFPQHFEAFAWKFGFSKKLSTYNINRVLYMKNLLEMGVEVLDIEPMIEKELASPFHFFLTLSRDTHPTNIGAYYLSQYICDHLNMYEYPARLQRNDYENEIVRFQKKTVYYGEEFKEMEDVIMAKDINPVSKDSPFLLAGDSFTMANLLKYFLATRLKTKINMISATTSSPITTRMLQMRTREISPNTKYCFLVNNTIDLHYDFLPFVDTSIGIYPDETRFPDRKFEAVGKDLQDEPSFEFDLDLSDLSLNSKKYKLVFSVSSTITQAYSLSINSKPAVVISSHSSGHGVIEYPLDRISQPMHIVLTTMREECFPAKQNLTLNLERIFLVEE